MAQDDYAIVVGITRYPGFQDLQGPVHDAEAFQAWLTDAHKGAVDPAHVRTCLTTAYHPPGPSDLNDVHPVEDEIHRLFRDLVPKAALGRHLGRRLYIYMAGHGFADPGDMRSAAIYAANAESLFAPHVTATEYADYFRQSAAFDEVVLVMDCCRVASPAQPARRPPLPTLPVRPAAAQVASFTAFGAAWAQVSREKPIGGVNRGIFTVSFIEALDQCPPDSQGRVTGQQVKNYVHNRINAVAGDVAVGPPEIDVGTAGDITFVVRQAGPAAAVTLRMPPGAEGRTLRISDSLREVFTARIDGPTVLAPLEPGFYKARIAALPFERLFEVTGGQAEIAL